VFNRVLLLSIFVVPLHFSFHFIQGNKKDYMNILHHCALVSVLSRCNDRNYIDNQEKPLQIKIKITFSLEIWFCHLLSVSPFLASLFLGIVDVKK